MQKNYFTSGFVVGALVGAAIAILTTPTTGAENLKRLKKKATEMKPTVDSLIEDALPAAKTFIDKSKSAIKKKITINEEQ